ncbi:hypothetical protein O0I10_007599 [Lichtheimia ornata]|uniref:Uncharacterized protein n=1 Tax=Lichtheimia ornata TaxID=688661 RepID=A0AAD7Y051_9FUNG|nr:uncharacterized protein O0I10_007599 [Lichtheimia ornata]KAJ8656752.1 hypothetical protein O0I10_007599 [Lichtheimia ornata]
MYTGWSQRMNAVSRLRWYNVNDLTDCCHQLRTLLLSPDFLENVVAQDVRPYQHQHIFHLLRGGECPASHLRRFPLDVLYVCEGIGDWGLRVDRLQMAMNLALFPERLDRAYPNIQTPGDADLTVFDALHDILEAIGGMVDLIDRNEFEERYHLNWIPAAHHHHHHPHQSTTTTTTTAAGTGRGGHHHHFYPPPPPQQN